MRVEQLGDSRAMTGYPVELPLGPLEGLPSIGPLLTVALVLPLLLLAGGAWVWLRRRRKQREFVEAALLRRLVHHVPSKADDADQLPSPAPSPGASRETLGTITVCEPSGQHRRVLLTRRPLTLGRSRTCDIVIDDEELRAEHARLRAISRDEVQIHAIAPPDARPFQRRDDDMWLIVRSGEQVALGSHYLQISMGMEIESEEDERPRLAEAG